MAKMFYTLDEAAEKLGKSADEVRDMAQSGQIQEFRDRDKLMFKVDQIDLLAGDDEPAGDEADMSSMIPLADDDSVEDDDFADFSLEDEVDLESPKAESGSGSLGIDDSGAGPQPSPAQSGSGSASALDLEPAPGDEEGEDRRERTGVSIFDADELETADPSAVTQVTDEGFDDMQLDSVGSGSGLLDLTRESDDTSLGAEFLDEIYPGEEQASGETTGSSGLFETTGDEGVPADAGVPGGMMVAAEPLDGPASGLTAGLSIGAVLALALGLVAVIMGLMETPADGVISVLADNFLIVVGAMAGVALIGGAIGFVMGRKS